MDEAIWRVRGELKLPFNGDAEVLVRERGSAGKRLNGGVSAPGARRTPSGARRRRLAWLMRKPLHGRVPSVMCLDEAARSQMGASAKSWMALVTVS